MRVAPTGHYRKLLADTYPSVRMAFTDRPMSGVTVVPKEPILEVLRQSDDEYAEYYINGLESGKIATIVETPTAAQEYWRSSELYLKS